MVSVERDQERVDKTAAVLHSGGNRVRVRVTKTKHCLLVTCSYPCDQFSQGFGRIYPVVSESLVESSKIVKNSFYKV